MGAREKEFRGVWFLLAGFCVSAAAVLALCVTTRAQMPEMVGRGVAEEALPHLFEQFWRADQARSSRNGEGTGLGLYIAKYIVEAHGGTIRAENSGGLAFTILLPRREGDHD